MKIELAATTASNAGVIQQAGNPLLHTYGTHNLFICTNAGNFALTGTENVGIGNVALLSVASGGNNVPIGYAAAVSLTLRIGNFALGSQALANNIDANANVAIGYLALNGLTGGSGANIAVGQQAGYQLSMGANNVLFGTGAGAGITTGSNNIIIGPLGGLSSTLASTVIIAPGGTERTRINSSAHTTFQGAVAPKSYTVATVPSAGAAGAGAGAMIYVSDESGGAVPAFSDGSDWRRVSDRAVIVRPMACSKSNSWGVAIVFHVAHANRSAKHPLLMKVRKSRSYSLALHSVNPRSMKTKYRHNGSRILSANRTSFIHDFGQYRRREFEIEHPQG